MSNLIFVVNDNVEVVGLLKFKCNACGHEFDISDSTQECPKCSTALFERMTKSSFKSLFTDSLIAIGIDEKRAKDFVKKKDIKLNTLGLCNQITSIMDSNFELKFGGQYKSFLVKETFNDIIQYNFHGD